MITAIHSGHNPLVSGRINREPDDFVDNAVKVFKIIDGVKTLVRTEKPYPDWWSGNCEMIATAAIPEHPNKKRKVRCPKREAPPEEELRQAYMELGPAITKLTKKYGAAYGTVRRWLREYGIIDIHNKPTGKAVQG